MVGIVRLTSWKMVFFSGPLGWYLLASFLLITAVSLLIPINYIINITSQASDNHVLCVSILAFRWIILVVIFVFFFICICFSLYLIFSEEDDIISKKTYVFIAFTIVTIIICLLSPVFLAFSDRDVLIVKIDITDNFAYQIEFNGEMDDIYLILLNTGNRSFPNEFQESNCTPVRVHDLCPTWGPLLYMNMMEFLRCPFYQKYDYPQELYGFRGKYHTSPSYIPSIPLIICVSMFVSSLLMTMYRRFVALDEWPDTQLLDFVGRPRSSVPDLLRSLITDFFPTYLRSLATDFLSAGETLE